MSTKIYQAYRLRASFLNTFLFHVQAKQVELAFGKTKRLMAVLDVEKILESEGSHFKAHIDSISRWDLPQPVKQDRIRWEILLHLYKKNYDNSARSNPFGIQTGWTFFFNKGYFYTWPWGSFILEDQEVLVFSDKVVDYSYWNNTDKPDEVSYQAWKARSKTWNEIHQQGEDLRLTFYTVDFSPMAYKTQLAIEEMLFRNSIKSL